MIKAAFLNCLKFAILVGGIVYLAYFFMLDPLSDYKRVSLITLSNKNKTNNDLEQLSMQMELEKIKNDSIDFTYNTIEENLDHMNSHTNIDFSKIETKKEANNKKH